MISVVVPTYNERENISNLVEQIDDALKGVEYEIIFVDDSTDDTPEIIKEVAKNYTSVRMEHRENEKDLSTAILRGFRIAKGEYLACMDADLQHPPKILRNMYNAMGKEVDICIPSRLIPGGDDGGLNWYRKLISRTAKVIGQISLPCLRKISDPTGGIFMVRKGIIENADLQPIGWKFMVEVLAMGTYKKIVEIPYEFQNRTKGQSKISVKVSWEYIKQLISLKKRYKKHNDFVVIRDC